MNCKPLGLVLAGTVALTACADQYSLKAGAIDSADFGAANRQTFAAMVVNPDPQYSEPLPTSAEHAAAAIERYDNDAVKQPRTIRSTATGGGGSGGSGGN